MNDPSRRRKLQPQMNFFLVDTILSPSHDCRGGSSKYQWFEWGQWEEANDDDDDNDYLSYSISPNVHVMSI